MHATVALLLPLQPLTYKVPDDLVENIKVGDAVFVPLRKKKCVAYVLSLHKEAPGPSTHAIKEISGIDQETASLSKELLLFFRWISEYYHYPIGEVISAALPPNTTIPQQKYYSLCYSLDAIAAPLKKKLQARGGKRWALLEKIRREERLFEWDKAEQVHLKQFLANGLAEEKYREKEIRFLKSKTQTSNIIHSPSDEQSLAILTIKEALHKNSFSCFLLEGVTGSGKTEVYLSCASAAIAAGKSVLFMVPEIALTPQLFSRVTNRLGNEVAILHSGLTNKERSEQWHLIRSGKANLVLGARSTIFAPMDNLGLVIVDEEHESAFKQEDRLRYNARDLALVRAQKNNACVILGSATPSLESFYNARTKKYQHLQLSKRITGSALPKVKIIDLKKTNATGSFSEELIREIHAVLLAKKQCMLFLNRRGFASYILCEGCGEVPSCPNCSVSLTYYQKSKSLLCHYCDYKIPLFHTCPHCDSEKLNPGTLGTESIEQQAKELFPAASVIRIDKESTEKRNSLEEALNKVASGAADIIIGTQMIAKGHDFPGVHLVAILNADTTINIPDFRSTERAFQLFTQMAGRAGRSAWQGQVLLQTYNPEHPSIQYAATHDYKTFAETELELRSAFHYPPFHKLCRIIISDPSEAKAMKFSTSVANDILQIAKNASLSLEILGPAPAVLGKIQNKYRWNILIKS